MSNAGHFFVLSHFVCTHKEYMKRIMTQTTRVPLYRCYNFPFYLFRLSTHTNSYYSLLRFGDFSFSVDLRQLKMPDWKDTFNASCSENAYIFERITRIRFGNINATNRGSVCDWVSESRFVFLLCIMRCDFEVYVREVHCSSRKAKRIECQSRNNSIILCDRIGVNIGTIFVCVCVFVKVEL